MNEKNNSALANTFEKIAKIADFADKAVRGLVVRGKTVRQSLAKHTDHPEKLKVDILGGIDVSDDETFGALSRSFIANLRKKNPEDKK